MEQSNFEKFKKQTITEGQRFGNYKIHQLVAQGGMGSIYKASDLKTGEYVAIKTIHASYLNTNVVERFAREVKVISKLSHQNIIKILHVGVELGIPYFVMEFISGYPLTAYFKYKKCSLDEKLDILKEVCEAVEYAHSQKIIHRDLKPSNIMVKLNGAPVLLDFGLAKSFRFNSSQKELTRRGEVLGTPHYMSPEQASGNKRQVEKRTDVYSLGAILYNILTDKPPAEGDTFMSILESITKRKLIPPKKRNPLITKTINNVCMKALEKEKKIDIEVLRSLALILKGISVGKKQWQMSFIDSKK